MQMDASINPGNSGGPVLDLHGDVVAIANAVNVSGQGIGFAIPMDIAKAVLPHLQETGACAAGGWASPCRTAPRSSATAYGLARARGVVVSDVVEEAPARARGCGWGTSSTGLDDAARGSRPPAALAGGRPGRGPQRGAAQCAEGTAPEDAGAARGAPPWSEVPGGRAPPLGRLRPEGSPASGEEPEPRGLRAARTPASP